MNNSDNCIHSLKEGDTYIKIDATYYFYQCEKCNKRIRICWRHPTEYRECERYKKGIQANTYYSCCVECNQKKKANNQKMSQQPINVNITTTITANICNGITVSNNPKVIVLPVQQHTPEETKEEMPAEAKKYLDCIDGDSLNDDEIEKLRVRYVKEGQERLEQYKKDCIKHLRVVDKLSNNRSEYEMQVQRRFGLTIEWCLKHNYLELKQSLLQEKMGIYSLPDSIYEKDVKHSTIIAALISGHPFKETKDIDWKIVVLYGLDDSPDVIRLFRTYHGTNKYFEIPIFLLSHYVRLAWKCERSFVNYLYDAWHFEAEIKILCETDQKKYPTLSSKIAQICEQMCDSTFTKGNLFPNFDPPEELGPEEDNFNPPSALDNYSFF